MKKIAFLICCALTFVNCSKKDFNNQYATIYGVVSDNNTGELISVASVVLSPGGKTKTTGTDGRYEFNDLDPAQYTVTVQKSGYQTNRKTVTAVIGERTEVNIPITKNN
ncbi:MAG: carboxypeptidase-like regulatory domain-containing protein [Marinilabiliaceae bacterium]|nr:carboxypeptidase-like regulatory domain-containing protein [Marinilabiliaceae bacterium]